ncbi:hypothetical protein LSTR_LSTR009972 [Laodelphax striatellus]|uniref:Uncharacterized protein n=1 Tax=Laodelphax striatellus TaxID=195883 RepID=A0A482XIU0_LAOST|nr:hypothetical protein LSTR_LSTR009972 [Laodelphax striatellus]
MLVALAERVGVSVGHLVSSQCQLGNVLARVVFCVTGCVVCFPPPSENSSFVRYFPPLFLPPDRLPTRIILQG